MKNSAEPQITNTDTQMGKLDHILFRKLLKKNHFIKSDTTDNKNLMEFTYGNFLADNYIIVYTYEEVEMYCCGFVERKIKTIDEFAELFTEITEKEFKK